MNETSVLNAVLEVFSEVGAWISEAVQSFIPMFYGTEGLTFLGVLAISGLSISICFLLISVISNFLHFRG